MAPTNIVHSSEERPHRIRTAFTLLLRVLGYALFLPALLATIACASALISRWQHGRGIMFADAEFFGLLAAVLWLCGAGLLFLANRLRMSHG